MSADHACCVAGPTPCRIAEPEEIADVVTSLCSYRSSFVTGHVMVADGGVLVNPHTI